MERNPDYSQLLRLAQSGAGQRLIQLLRQNGGQALDQALSHAAAGDYAQAKKLLGSLLDDPQAQSLLKSLEEDL